MEHGAEPPRFNKATPRLRGQKSKPLGQLLAREGGQKALPERGGSAPCHHLRHDAFPVGVGLAPTPFLRFAFAAYASTGTVFLDAVFAASAALARASRAVRFASFQGNLRPSLRGVAAVPKPMM